MTDALHRFDQERYDLDSYVVMPNHVHVIVRPYTWSGAALEQSGAALEQSGAALQPASESDEVQAKALHHTGGEQAKALHHTPRRGLAGAAQATKEYQCSLSGILKQWKGGSARELNKGLGRQGALWMDESFDHVVRSEAQLKKFRTYIRENPATPHLKDGMFACWESPEVVGECDAEL